MERMILFGSDSDIVISSSTVVLLLINLESFVADRNVIWSDEDM